MSVWEQFYEKFIIYKPADHYIPAVNFSFDCPYCKKENKLPMIVKNRIQNYGSDVIQCIHCKYKVNLIFDSPLKKLVRRLTYSKKGKTNARRQNYGKSFIKKNRK